MPLFILIALLILFADDPNAIIKGKNFHEVNGKTDIVNKDFVNFAENNYLKINGSKTKVLQMHTWQIRKLVPPQIQINNINVEVHNTGKLLGVHITDTMSWKEQCDKVSNKLRSFTYLFTILCKIVSTPTLRTVYYAYAQSQILYSIVIWGGSSYLESVFVAQKRVLRAMADGRYSVLKTKYSS
jgi:putative lipoic acid-binding regulatory protein